MPDPCVQQSWCARNGRESSRRECYGKSSLREWYAQTRSGRGSQRGGVGKYLNSPCAVFSFANSLTMSSAQKQVYSEWVLLSSWSLLGLEAKAVTSPFCSGFVPVLLCSHVCHHFFLLEYVQIWNFCFAGRTNNSIKSQKTSAGLFLK